MHGIIFVCSIKMYTQKLLLRWDKALVLATHADTGKENTFLLYKVQISSYVAIEDCNFKEHVITKLTVLIAT